MNTKQYSYIHKSRDSLPSKKKSSIPFESFDFSVAKKSKKKQSKIHNRTSSFKGQPDSKGRDFGQIFGIKKQSLLKTIKQSRDVGFFKSSKRDMKLKETLDFGSQILKLSQSENSKNSFRRQLMAIVTDHPSPKFNLSKSDLRDIFRSFFDFFSKNSKSDFGSEPKRVCSISTQTESPNFEELKLEAKRQIIDGNQENSGKSLKEQMVVLYQKELLLDEILQILNEEDIDLNNLLSITLERIEANHYEPPKDIILENGISLRLEDKMRMPTPKWTNSILTNQLKLDLSDVNASETDSAKNNYKHVSKSKLTTNKGNKELLKILKQKKQMKFKNKLGRDEEDQLGDLMLNSVNLGIGNIQPHSKYGGGNSPSNLQDDLIKKTLNFQKKNGQNIGLVNDADYNQPNNSEIDDLNMIDDLELGLKDEHQINIDYAEHNIGVDDSMGLLIQNATKNRMFFGGESI